MSTEPETPNSEPQVTPTETLTDTTPASSLVTEATAPAATAEPAAEFVPLTATDLAFPEGHTVDETLTSEFLDVVNSQELTAAERANKLIELQGKVLTAASEASSAAWDKTQSEWQAEVKTSYGDKFTGTMESVAKLVEEFGTPELKQVFDLTGAGNNVHMVKFLANLADKLTEGGGPMPGNAVNAQTAAQRLFPSMKG